MERDLAGFPVLYAPADMDIWAEDAEMQAALARAEHIVSSIRRDSREGLVLPGGKENGWQLELLSSGSRRQFDTNAIIDRYDKRIATSVLADFVMMGQQAVGSFALADTKTQVFAMAIGTYLDIICEVFNIQAIPRLIDLNAEHFKGITDYPTMTHGDIEERDLTQFTTFVKEMVGIGVVTPDEELEKEVRRIGHLPEKIETEEGQEQEQPEQNEVESKTMYKIMAVLDKYQQGKTTRAAATQLLDGLTLDEKQINFYLDEAEKGIQAYQKEQAKKEDQEDAKQAEEAKKSLGRIAKFFKGDENHG